MATFSPLSLFCGFPAVHKLSNKRNGPTFASTSFFHFTMFKPTHHPANRYPSGPSRSRQQFQFLHIVVLALRIDKVVHFAPSKKHRSRRCKARTSPPSKDLKKGATFQCNCLECVTAYQNHASSVNIRSMERVYGGYEKVLSGLRAESRTHREILYTFYNGWRHPNKPVPRVIRIMRIDFSEKFMRSANQYRNDVDKSMKSPSNKPGNTTYLFHGTRVMCQIGYQSNYNQACADSHCSLCRIIRYSFSLEYTGSASQFKRFGDGLYFSSISSKCDDYVRVPKSSNRTKGSNSLRVLIIANVVLGTVWATKENVPHLKGPPPGFHSVMGKPGRALNYEEHVVYDDRAVRPAYIVVYQ